MPKIKLKMKNPGFVPDPRDARDYEADHILFGSAPFEWKAGYDVEKDLGIKLPVKDQGSSSSCVGQSIATGAYIMNIEEMQGKGFEGKEDQLPEFSAKSVYSQISLGAGIGAYTRDGLQLLKDYGINRESKVPSYRGGRPPTERYMLDKKWMKRATKHNARNFRSKEYRFLQDKKDIDLVAKAIRDSHFVILGFHGSNDGGWSTKFPKPPTYRNWSHLVAAVGAEVIKGKKYIKIINSWGKNVGDKGIQWISEDYFKSGNAHYGAVVIDKPNTWAVRLIDKNGKRRTVLTTYVNKIKKLLNEGFTFGNK